MRVRLGALVLMSCLAVWCPTRGWAGMQAPAYVVAADGGGFTYQWIFVVDAPFMIAGLGSSDLFNTSGHTHGDCLCQSFCAVDVGDTVRYFVYGNLVDAESEGQVSNWLAGCGAGGGSSTTTILPHGTTDVADPGSELALRVWSQPNPSHGRTRLSYVLPAPGPVSLELYDLMGRSVARLVDGVESAGTHTVVLNAGTSGSPSLRGIYFARLEFAGQARIARIVVF